MNVIVIAAAALAGAAWILLEDVVPSYVRARRSDRLLWILRTLRELDEDAPGVATLQAEARRLFAQLYGVDGFRTVSDLVRRKGESR